MDTPTHPAAAPRTNGVLAAFPAAAWRRVEQELHPVWLTTGQSLYAPGFPLSHVYFPVSGIVSLLIDTTDGHTAATATVGGEGIVGMALFMGGETTPSSAMVTSAGWAYRLGADCLRAEFDENEDVRHLLLRYTQALITQIAQMAVCNRYHSVEQQFCRWLLQSLDRTASYDVNMTQEMIAHMLGVRREGISEAASRLQKLGVISYRRGQITVIDRPQLATLCCECYGVVAREYDRLLGPYLHAARHMIPSPAAAPAKRHTNGKAWIGRQEPAPGRLPVYSARTATNAAPVH
jgi:CRP-like cAMP-binding protein